MERVDELVVVGIETRTIFPLGDSWVVTIPSDTLKAIQERAGQQKKYFVKVYKLGNGDILVKISDLLVR